mmetsp:Transcript_121089/g.337948  ORF Transcript_121089/g.337948 Transcript_121089/m.337948 type:complete len:186 (+) Transcript_121089:743-1300(+)
MKEAMATKKPDCVILTACSLNTPWFSTCAATESSAKPRVAGFDLTASSAAALVNKSFDAVVDQQAFLQGYLPVLLLTIKMQTGLSLLNPWIASGPTLEDPETVGEIVACMQKGFPTCGAKPLLTLKAFEDAQRPIEASPPVPMSALALGGFVMFGVLATAAFAWRRFKLKEESNDPSLVVESLLE